MWSDLKRCLESDELRKAYFPRLDLIQPRLDKITLCLYLQALLAMNEAPLHLDRIGAWEAFRLIWLRTRHPPLCVRFVHEDHDYSLAVRALDGQGGYEWGQLALSQDRSLTKADWLKLRRLLKKADFWHLDPEGDCEGLDGADWYLEGGRLDRSAIVHRWSAGEEGPDGRFRDAFLYLVSLGDVGPWAEPIY